MNEQGSELDQTTLWGGLKKHLKVFISDSIGRAQGKPSMLIRGIEEEKISPTTVHSSKETVWLPSIPKWEDWCRDALKNTPKEIDFYAPENNRLQRRPREVEEISNLIQIRNYQSFDCDIKEVHGIAASKSNDIPYKDIKEFSEKGCSEFLPQGFDKNIMWPEIRLHSMRFENKEWAGNNYHWLNSGGSHHFAAAWHNAHTEKRNYTLSGTLREMTVNKSALFALSQKWDMYIMDKTTAYCEFMDAMESFNCSFVVCPVPRGIFASSYIARSGKNIGGYGADGKLVIIMLLRGCDKQEAVSRELEAGGFTSFRPYLMSLVDHTKGKGVSGLTG